VAAGKGIDEARWVIATAHRQRCELQPSRPAFGPRIEGQDVVWAEIQTHELVEKGLGLAGGEAQVGRPHLDQVRPAAQPCQRQRWVGTSGDGEAHVAG
jgi:hypothetical protein